MSTQKELAATLTAVLAQQKKTSAEIEAVQASTTALKEQISSLEAIIAAGGTVSPELQAAVDAVRQQAQLIDDQIPDLPPVPEGTKITSALVAGGTVGQGFSYGIGASGSPTRFGASPLPAGLTIDETNGVITGTPTEAGVTEVGLTASGPNGLDSKILVVQINAVEAPAPAPEAPAAE